MVADGLLTRQRYREVPPRVDYDLTERSRDLMPVLGALARWGFDWTWSAPRRGEAIDVTAIFRLAAGLVAPVPGRTGTVELRVTDGPIYAVKLGAETVEGHEQPAPDAEATVAGAVADWVAALGARWRARGPDRAGRCGPRRRRARRAVRRTGFRSPRRRRGGRRLTVPSAATV